MDEIRASKREKNLATSRKAGSCLLRIFTHGLHRWVIVPYLTDPSFSQSDAAARPAVTSSL